MTEYIHIGRVKIAKTAALAPMADAGDSAFRITAKRFGAAYSVGEMTSAKGIVYGAEKTLDLLKIDPRERANGTPAAVQLFGNEPAAIARAAEVAVGYSPDIIDINAGCPVNKVVGGGAGSALMQTPALFAEVVGAAVRACESSGIPVTVKIRAGWDDENRNAVEIAKIAESCGAEAVTVHGRTREQFYSGRADWGVIAAVKATVKIPVIGNGDVDGAESCAAMYRETGCDLVMIGRAAFGNPWIFREIAEYISTGSVPAPPTPAERAEVIREHIGLACELKGERVAMRESRKQIAWYIKGTRGAAALRDRCMRLCTLDEFYGFIDEVFCE